MTRESATECSGPEENEKNKIETSKEIQEEDPREEGRDLKQRKKSIGPKLNVHKRNTKKRGELNAKFIDTWVSM